MPAYRPPHSIVVQLDRLVPGLLHAFVSRARHIEGIAEVRSWWRSPSHNASVRGSPDSQHLIATGADLLGDRARIVASARRAGLIALDYGSHVHVQLLPQSLARRSGLLGALRL